jgi:transposase
MLRRYGDYQIYGDAGQVPRLHRSRLLIGAVYNGMVQMSHDQIRRTSGGKGVRHRDGKILPSAYDLCRELKPLRQQCPEFKAVPVASYEEVARFLDESWAAFFRNIAAGNFQRAGEPRYKRRDQMTSIPLGVMQNAKTGQFQTKGWVLVQCEDNPRNWLLHVAGISKANDRRTWMHVRGKLPADPALWRNGTITWKAGKWWLSICLEIPRPTEAIVGDASCGRQTRVEFDLLDDFVRVNGIAETPPDLLRTAELQDALAALKRQFDLDYPYTDRRRLCHDAYRQKAEARLKISRLSLKIANIRRNALHVWTTRLVRGASDITVVMPPVLDYLKSARGDPQNWGANVAPVSELHEHVLNFAPSAAIAMLQYKAETKGIRCDVVEAEDTKLKIGPELVKAGKLARRASRLSRAL